MVTVKMCPIEATMKYIGKKWSVHILRDMFFGKKRFKDFLEANPKLSTKVLSERLRELEKNKLIEKRIVNTDPVLIHYELTQKGKALKGILYELSLFSFTQYSSDITEQKLPRTKIEEMLKNTFG